MVWRAFWVTYLVVGGGVDYWRSRQDKEVDPGAETTLSGVTRWFVGQPGGVAAFTFGSVVVPAWFWRHIVRPLRWRTK